jgi:CheY-like chemotaxis protein
MALESDYDLLVLDLNLPKLDGIGVLSSIRPKKPSLPGIAPHGAQPRRRSWAIALRDA